MKVMMYKGRRVEILQGGPDLTQIQAEGTEDPYWGRTSELKEIRMTREEKYQAQVSVIRQSPVAYQVAGWLATHDSKFHVSTPPKTLEQTIDELIEHGVDYETGVTLTKSTDATQGRSYSVVTDNHGLSDELFLKTGVVSTVYHDNLLKVSMQAKQFILDFLLDELKFKLGKTQDFETIRARVPAQFMVAFERGALVE